LIQTLATAVGLQFPSPLWALWEIVRMPIEAVIYVKCYDLKTRKTSTAQAHDAFGHLVLLDYNTIGYVLRINHWEIMCKNIMYFPHRGCVRTPRTLYDYATVPHRGLGQLLSSVFSSQGVCTHPTHIIWLRHCPPSRFGTAPQLCRGALPRIWVYFERVKRWQRFRFFCANQNSATVFTFSRDKCRLAPDCGRSCMSHRWWVACYICLRTRKPHVIAFSDLITYYSVLY